MKKITRTQNIQRIIYGFKWSTSEQNDSHQILFNNRLE